MRIFSKFIDYYDKVQAFGADDSVVYIRNREYTNDCGIDLQDTRSYRDKYTWKKYKSTHEMQRGAIIFCGKIYKFVQLHCGKAEYSFNPYSFPYTIAYDYTSMVEALKKLCEETYPKNPEALYKNTIIDFPNEEFFKVLDTNLNIERKCPIIYQKSGSIYEDHLKTDYNSMLNPCLKYYDFFKVKDPFTAYMELDMYLSGVLGNSGNPMVNISDKDKVYKHGFDPEYGFRKRKNEI
jgi:hypothetical protein